MATPALGTALPQSFSIGESERGGVALGVEADPAQHGAHNEGADQGRLRGDPHLLAAALRLG